MAARRSSARRRRHRRFTPRRWLPFVALTALVVGAVMVSSEEPATGPEVVDPVLDATRLPLVTRRDAISTAWYCAGGTASPEEGIADLSIVLANDADRGAVAEVTVYDQEGEQAATEVAVPAYGRARLAVSSVLPGDWVGATVEVRGGRVAVDREVTGPLGFDSAPCTTEAGDHWYVPSGSTLRGAKEYLTVFNPFPDSASVSISFATNTGQRTPRALRALSIPGGSVRVIDVGEVITNRSEIAATVVARSGRIVVDRVQTYNGTGDPVTGEGSEPITTEPPKGLVSTTAVPVRSPRWVFPAARVSPGVRTQIAIYNPGAKSAEVDVAIGYQEPDRYPAVEPIGLTIRPREQVIVDLTDLGLLVDTDFWIDVRSLDGVPVVAERLSFFGEPGSRSGASATVGSPVAATDWLVTQGGASNQRTTTVQVLNPGDTDTQVEVFVLSDGDRTELTSAAVLVPGGDRRSLDLEGAGPAATVIVHAGKPVVVGSSLALVSGQGISVQPAFPFPETVVALPPIS